MRRLLHPSPNWPMTYWNIHTYTRTIRALTLYAREWNWGQNAIICIYMYIYIYLSCIYYMHVNIFEKNVMIRKLTFLSKLLISLNNSLSFSICFAPSFLDMKTNYVRNSSTIFTRLSWWGKWKHSRKETSDLQSLAGLVELKPDQNYNSQRTR